MSTSQAGPTPTTTTTTSTTSTTRDRAAVRGPLARSGALDAWLPRPDGTAPWTVREIADRLTALGAEDADLGWIGAVAAVTNLAVVEFPDETVREIRATDGDTLVCGTLAPQGTGTWVGDDLHVRAVSSPASGLPWADWVMATVRDVDTDGLVRVLVPVDDVRIETTWDAAGLRGSGGDTAHLEDVVVPGRRARALTPSPSAAPLPFYASVFFAAPLIGVVHAALQRVLTAVDEGGPRWARADLRESVSSAALQVAHAEALHDAAVAGLGTRAEVDALTAVERATAADLAVQALAAAEGALPLLVTAIGAAALHAEHPLARAVRDVGVGARHTALSPAKAALAHRDALFDGRA